MLKRMGEVGDSLLLAELMVHTQGDETGGGAGDPLPQRCATLQDEPDLGPVHILFWAG